MLEAPPPRMTIAERRRKFERFVERCEVDHADALELMQKDQSLKAVASDEQDGGEDDDVRAFFADLNRLQRDEDSSLSMQSIQSDARAPARRRLNPAATAINPDELHSSETMGASSDSNEPRVVQRTQLTLLRAQAAPRMLSPRQLPMTPRRMAAGRDAPSFTFDGQQPLSSGGFGDSVQATAYGFHSVEEWRRAFMVVHGLLVEPDFESVYPKVDIQKRGALMFGPDWSESEAMAEQALRV